jgi:uncharacterized membrane protein YfcA
MMPELTLLLGGLLVLFVAFFVKGISSFGPALVSMPLLGLLWDAPHLAVPMLALINIPANGVLLKRFAGTIRWKTVGRLLTGTLVGIPLGVYLLETLNSTQLRIFIGVAVLLSVPAIMKIRTLLPNREPTFLPAFVAGILSGVCGGAVAIDGPPYVAYLAATMKNKEERYGTLVAVFFFGAIARVVVYAAFSSLQVIHFELTLMAVPAVGLGLFCGVIAYQRLSERGFDWVMMAVLVASGGGLVIQALLH